MGAWSRGWYLGQRLAVRWERCSAKIRSKISALFLEFRAGGGFINPLRATGVRGGGGRSVGKTGRRFNWLQRRLVQVSPQSSAGPGSPARQRAPRPAERSPRAFPASARLGAAGFPLPGSLLEQTPPPRSALAVCDLAAKPWGAWCRVSLPGLRPHCARLLPAPREAAAAQSCASLVPSPAAVLRRARARCCAPGRGHQGFPAEETPARSLLPGLTAGRGCHLLGRCSGPAAPPVPGCGRAVRAPL